MSKKQPPKRNPGAYMKYAGMASQMVAIILIAVFGGGWLDDYFGFEKKIITVVLLLVLMVTYFYSIYRDLMSDK